MSATPSSGNAESSGYGPAFLQPTQAPAPSRSSLDRIFTALDTAGRHPQLRGTHIKARCPLHEDVDPSLSIDWTSEHDGRIKIFCHACKAPDTEILEALGLGVADLFDQPLPPREPAAKTRRRTTAATPKPRAPRLGPLPARLAIEPPAEQYPKRLVRGYDYVDEHGAILGRVARYEWTDAAGTSHKTFVQERPTTGDRWVKKSPDRKVLRHLPAVIDAISKGLEVWLVEGEKDDESANRVLPRAVGVATTNAGGAGSLGELVDQLVGARLVVVGDRDGAGYRRMGEAVDRLDERTESLRLLLPATVEPKSDLTDHLEAGHPLDDLIPVDRDQLACLLIVADIEANAKTAATATERVELALREVKARLAAAEAATNRGAEAAAEEERRFAKRWAHEAAKAAARAVEHAELAVTNREKLAGRVDTLQVQMPAGTDRTGDLVDDAVQAQLHAQQVTLQAWELVGAEPPETVAAVLAAPDPSVVTDPEVGPDLSLEEHLQRVGLLPSAPPLPPTPSGPRVTIRETPNRSPGRFMHRHGETVKVTGDAMAPDYTVVWRCEVHVLSQMIDDDGDDLTAPVGGRWHLLLRRPLHNASGRPSYDENDQPLWETAEVEFGPKAVREGSWTESLPWPGLILDLTTRGKSTALTAAMLSGSMPRQMARRYTATGWRQLDGRDVFIHAGGGIDADGHVDLPHVALDGPLGVYAMRPPTTDVTELQYAVRDGLSPLLHLPSAIIAPLIGMSFRAVFGSPQASLHLVGEPGSGKTSITRCAAMSWFAPEMREHGRGARKHVFSALEDTGDTLKGMLNALSAIADLPTLIDDYKGPKAAARLGALQSTIWNGGGRTTSNRDRGRDTSGAPRCVPITTGETSSTGSSATRALTIRVGADALVGPTGDIFALMSGLERRDNRWARGTLGASFIQWVAGRREQLLGWLDEIEEESPYIDYWVQVAATLDHESGVRGRLVRTAMSCTSGWVMLLTWLLDAKVLTRDDADTIWALAIEGLTEQLCMQDPSSVDGPRHLLDLLRSSLLAGNCHLSSQAGSVPEEIQTGDSSDCGVPYGWAPRQAVTGPLLTGGQFRPEEIIWQARGDRVGILTDTEVWLMPRPVLGVINQMAAKAGETFPHSSVSIGSAMASRGWIAANGAGDRSANRRVARVQQRVWVMPRHILDGTEDDPNAAPRTLPPLPPSPWDLPGADLPVPPPSSQEPIDLDDSATAAPAETEARTEQPPAEDPSPAGLVDVVDQAVAEDLQGSPPAAPEPGPARRERHARPQTGADRWLAAAAVVTGDELVLPDGTRVHLGPEVSTLVDLAELANQLQLGHGGGTHVLPSPGQLLLTLDGMRRFGIDLDADQLAEISSDPEETSAAVAAAGKTAAAAVREAGWNLSGDELRVWTRLWRTRTEDTDNISVQLVLVPLMGAFDDSMTLTVDDPDPATLARRAQMVADTLGVTWGASGGVTGLTLLRNLRKATGRALVAEEYVSPPPPLKNGGGRTPNSAILWLRKPTSDEAGRDFIHAYDANAMYLSALGATEVGVGEPTHHAKGTAFSKKVAGLWKIKAGGDHDWRLPDLTQPATQLSGDFGWYTTPVIRYLMETGQDPQILESYTWPNSTRRYFDRWTEIVRDARTSMQAAAADGDPDAAIVLGAVKGVYTRLIGRFAREGDAHLKSPLYRPDWRLAIVSTANANLIRKLRSAGETADLWPVAVSTDEVFYLSDTPDPVEALPSPLQLGDGLGRFKVTRSTSLTDEIRKGLGGGRLGEFLKVVPKVGD